MLDRLHFADRPNFSDAAEFRSVWRILNQRFMLSALLLKNELEENTSGWNPVDQITHDLKRQQTHLLRHHQVAVDGATRFWASTGPDEFTEYDPDRLELLTTKTDAKGWSEAEQSYL